MSAELRFEDEIVGLHADVVDDLERTRIATENRIRSLLSPEEWGKGVDPESPQARQLEELLDDLRAMEARAVKRLRRSMRDHPLGDWVRRTKGVGEKVAGRLLGEIGDPGTRPNVAKLWAFCGLHVVAVPNGQDPGDAQSAAAEGGGDHAASVAHVRPIPPPTGQIAPEAQSQSAASGAVTGHRSDGDHESIVGVAPRRTRGQKANWSTEAKKRVWLIAASCIKHRSSPYRDVYDQAREKYADAVHRVVCPRCGPAGKPAQPGAPLSAGHKHARAMRIVMKEILKDMWLESRGAMSPAETIVKPPGGSIYAAA